MREPAAQSSHADRQDSLAALAATHPGSGPTRLRVAAPPSRAPLSPGRRAAPLLPHLGPSRLGPARGGHTIWSRAWHRGFAGWAVDLRPRSRAQLTSLGIRRRPDPDASFPTRPSWRLSVRRGLEPTRLGARAGRREM